MNPDVIADNLSLQETLRDKVVDQYTDLFHNSIRGKEEFTCKVVSSGPEGDINHFHGKHMFTKARPIGTLHDHFTPDPCSDLFSEAKIKLLISLQPTIVSIRTMMKNMRPPKFGDSVVMTCLEEGPNSHSAKLRDPRYKLPHKKNDFNYGCAFTTTKKLSQLFRSGIAALGFESSVRTKNFEEDLKAALALEGITITVSSRKRSLDQQVILIKRMYTKSGYGEVQSVYGKAMAEAVKNDDNDKIYELAEAKKSSHLTGDAIDIPTKGFDDDQLQTIVNEIRAAGGGIFLEPVSTGCWIRGGPTADPDDYRKGGGTLRADENPIRLKKSGDPECIREHIHVTIPKDYGSK